MVSLQRTPDILVLTETWLTPEDKNSININGYYSFNIVRENRQHRGVSIFVRQHVDCTLLDQFSFINDDIEMCTISMKLNNKTHIIYGIYRPRFKYDNVDVFQTKLGEIL